MRLTDTLNTFRTYVAGGSGPVAARNDVSDDHYQCDCGQETDDPWRRGFTRRKFLRGGGAALAVAPLAAQLTTTRMAFAQTPNAAGAATNTIVVVFLRGGCDGLSFVVPHGDPGYARRRENIAVPTNLLEYNDELFGLHPGLAGPLGKYWESGQFGAVQAVAIDKPDYSHEQATIKYERAADANVGSGWANRYIEASGLSSTFQGVSFDGGLDRSLQGPAPALALRRVGDFRLRGPNPDGLSTALGALYGESEHPVAVNAQTTRSALDTAAKVAAAEYQPAAEYPGGGFANALKEVARVKKANIGLQVACVDVGGWDTHTNMDNGGDPNGDMYRHVADLGAALGAFCDDLGEALNTTTIVTCSEFGRRVQQNDSGGVDHGYGNCMLAIGGGVNGGKVHGPWPTLADDALEKGNLAKGTDYRDVLGELCVKRGNLGSTEPVFPGHQYSELGVFKRA